MCTIQCYQNIAPTFVAAARPCPGKTRSLVLLNKGIRSEPGTRQIMFELLCCNCGARTFLQKQVIGRFS